MLRLVQSTHGALAAIALAGCATMNVSSHVERAIDFAQYHTYAWTAADALPTGDPRLDKNPYFHDHMQGEVEKQLRVKGFDRATEGPPDLLIHYHASVNTRIDVNRIDREYGYCYDENCTARVIEYEAGTLVLDIVDARTQQVIWRGWAQDTLAKMLDNQDRMSKTIRSAVGRMLARFPDATTSSSPAGSLPGR